MGSMTSLRLSWNPIERGWERLSSLHLLRELALQHCNLTERPEALAGMRSMTSLELGWNDIERGWERLRPLLQLELL